MATLSDKMVTKIAKPSRDVAIMLNPYKCYQIPASDSVKGNPGAQPKHPVLSANGPSGSHNINRLEVS